MRAIPLLVLLVAAVGVLVLGGMVLFGEPDPVPTFEDEMADGPRERTGPSEPPAGPSAVELPEQERILVLREGQIPIVEGEPPRPDVLVRIQPEKAGGAVTGQDVLRAVSAVVPLRTHDAGHLEALRRLDAPPGIPEGEPVPLDHVLAHWREQGFEVIPAGAALLIVERPRQEEPPR